MARSFTTRSQPNLDADRASFIAAADLPLEPTPASPDAAITDRATAVRSASNAFETLDRQCAGATDAAALAKQRLAAEFDAIVAMPDVAEVTITPNELVVTTRALTMANGTVRYDIGAYRIRINRTASASYWSVVGITFEPLHDRRGKNARGNEDPHPYIHMDSGGPCWGTLRVEVREALQRQEFDVLVQLCLIFLTATPAGGIAQWTRPVLEAIGRPIGQ